MSVQGSHDDQRWSTSRDSPTSSHHGSLGIRLPSIREVVGPEIARGAFKRSGDIPAQAVFDESGSWSPPPTSHLPSLDPVDPTHGPVPPLTQGGPAPVRESASSGWNHLVDESTPPFINGTLDLAQPHLRPDNLPSFVHGDLHAAASPRALLLTNEPNGQELSMTRESGPRQDHHSAQTLDPSKFSWTSGNNTEAYLALTNSTPTIPICIKVWPHSGNLSAWDNDDLIPGVLRNFEAHGVSHSVSYVRKRDAQAIVRSVTLSMEGPNRRVTLESMQEVTMRLFDQLDSLPSELRRLPRPVQIGKVRRDRDKKEGGTKEKRPSYGWRHVAPPERSDTPPTLAQEQ